MPESRNAKLETLGWEKHGHAHALAAVVQAMQTVVGEGQGDDLESFSSTYRLRFANNRPTNTNKQAGTKPQQGTRKGKLMTYNPPIPTDNLYKFIALSGLAIAAFFWWYPSQLNEKITPRIYEARLALIEYREKLREFLPPFDRHFARIFPSTYPAIDSRYDAADRQLWKAMNRFLIAISEVQEKAILETDIEGMVHKDFEQNPQRPSVMTEKEVVVMLKEASQELVKQPRQIRREAQKAELSLAKVWDLTEMRESYRRMSFIGVPIGLGLSITGFYLWYRRVQRYQDQLLLAQIAKTTQEGQPK